MSKGDPIPPLPADAPKAGEIYKHYKGDNYKIVLLAEHSNDNEWIVVYQPMYDFPDADYFCLPLREWVMTKEWEGQQVPRFTKIS